jgi:GNAT superfamily N-acetyltransferase
MLNWDFAIYNKFSPSRVRPVTTRIRRAYPHESRQLTVLAHAAKRHWRYPERWICLWRNELTLTPHFVRTHSVYCAVRDGRIVEFYALSHRGARFELEHLWVHPDHACTGIGTTLFRHALRVTRSHYGRVLKVASDPNAEGFYRALGARPVGEVPSIPRGRRLPLLEVKLPTARRANPRLERTGRLPANDGRTPRAGGRSTEVRWTSPQYTAG